MPEVILRPDFSGCVSYRTVERSKPILFIATSGDFCRRSSLHHAAFAFKERATCRYPRLASGLPRFGQSGAILTPAWQILRLVAKSYRQEGWYARISSTAMSCRGHGTCVSSIFDISASVTSLNALCGISTLKIRFIPCAARSFGYPIASPARFTKSTTTR